MLREVVYGSLRVRLVKTAEINSVIAVTGFFRYLLNKKLRRSPFFRCFSEFRYLGFRYSSRYLYFFLKGKLPQNDTPQRNLLKKL